MTSSMIGAKAAMLDRDGTIIPDRTYTNDPKDVTLIPGAADAIRLLAAHGYPSVVITNQSGIARGLVSLSQYRAVRLRLAELLAAEGATLLDTFSCPHHPDFGLPCDCRKPATGMYERAAVTHRLDLSRCLFIGDKARDLAPAVTFKARAALVRSTNTANVDVSFADSISAPAFPTLLEAVTRLLEPRSWSS
ncbi:D-glycero-beta-D-manno-heptose 1,7-bisphosphate 7-phosphatase [soil metagenome]